MFIFLLLKFYFRVFSQQITNHILVTCLLSGLDEIERWLGLHIIVTIPSSDLSQEIFAINVFKALKSFLGDGRKDILQLLPLYRD